MLPVDVGALSVAARDAALDPEGPRREPVEPVVAEIEPAVELASAVVAVGILPGAAPPVEEHLGVEVVARRPVVAKVLDAPLVVRIIADDVGHPDAWRDDSALRSVREVVEDERQPGDWHVLDVEDCRPRDENPALNELDLLGLEVVVGMRIAAAGDRAIARKELLLGRRAAVALEVRTPRAEEPGLAALDRCRNVGHRAAPILDVVGDATERDDISRALRRVAEDRRVA